MVNTQAKIEIENENVNNIENVNNEPYVSLNYMRTPKWLLEMDENIIDNLDGKRSSLTVQLWATNMFNRYFSDKKLTKQYQIFVQFLKSYKITPLLRKLKIYFTKKLEKIVLL